MRKGVIDLDWLDGVIEDIELCHKIVPEGLDSLLGLLKEVRSKCTPIQEQTINGYVVTKGEWTNATIEDQKLNYFISKTCINDWESNKYCSNQNKCQMCKIKQ